MSSPPKIGGIKLYDSVIPDLSAGLYRLSSSLDITDGATTLAGPSEQNTFFDVFAPRFTLDPNEISDCFPPPQSKGAFSERLPHIAMWRRTLPWARRVFDNDQPGQKPWLALLLVKEDEADIETGTLSSLLPASVVTKLGNRDPIDGDPTVTVLKVKSLDTFKKILPRQNELPLLSHVRQVNMADTALAGDDDDGWFSVVVANRLPLVQMMDGPTNYLACLVSLEARDDAFNTQNASAAPPLIMLYSWRFGAARANGTFEQLAEDLDLAAFGGGDQDAALVDDEGRITLAHTQHNGKVEKNKYRGPLLGLSAGALPTQSSDISFSAAHELGRLLGIADGRFLRQMVDWHRKAEAEIRAELEAEELAAHMSGFQILDANLTVASLQTVLISNLNVNNLSVADIGRITLEGETP